MPPAEPTRDMPVASSSAFLDSNDRSIVIFVKRLVDPAVIQACLFISLHLNQVQQSRSIILLAILVFALTYPGTLPFRYKQIGLLGKILSSWLLVVLALSVLGWSLKAREFLPMEPLVQWVIVTPLAIYFVHLLSPFIAPRVFQFQQISSAVVVGVSESGLRIAATLNDDPLAAAKVIAFFDDRSAERLQTTGAVPLIGDLNEVGEYVKANFVQTIYVCLPMASQPRILKLLDDIRDTTASVYFVPDVFVFDLMQARMDSVGGLPVLAVCETPFHGTVGMLKRWSDIVISLIAILLIFPVLICTGIAVKLSSAGPIIYRQKRYGLDGREIEVWKFRSMLVDAGSKKYVEQAKKDDPRLTSIGAFLRRTSIDELPQFFNVLQGRMSVVGPRPHAVSHNETYRKVISGYMIRHKVKPGITGWAQVNGARGETETIEKMQKRIEFDLYYLRHWSLKFDLQIIFKTALTVLRDPNAY